jgi:hypothetical protein
MPSYFLGITRTMVQTSQQLLTLWISVAVMNMTSHIHYGNRKGNSLSTSTTLIITNDPVKIAEDFATLQILSRG